MIFYDIFIRASLILLYINWTIISIHDIKETLKSENPYAECKASTYYWEAFTFTCLLILFIYLIV